MEGIRKYMDIIQFTFAVDESLIRGFFYHAIFVAPGRPPYPQDIVDHENLRGYWENWGRPGDAACIAWRDKRAIGAVWLRSWANVSFKGYGFVSDSMPELSMAVLPECRSRGIGTRLLANLLERARATVPEICLSVQKKNPARRLYERSGFVCHHVDGNSWTMTRKTPNLPLE